MKKILFILTFISVTLLAACGDVSHAPVDVTLDTDQCHTCHMGIEDLEAASQTILEDGTPLFFDDIGCMLVYLQSTDDEVAVSYVIDQNSGEWIDLSDSYFVHDENIQTPMSYGFIAFDSEEDAENYRTESGQGELLTGTEIVNIDSASLEDWNSMHQEEHGHHD